MRLTSLALENYGCFAAARLDLDARPGHINLVVGPNGAGKTVLRRAFRDLLFGIPGQTPMAFRFGYQGMRIVAQGVDDAGIAFELGRRKGQGNTLFDAAGRRLDPHAIRRLIGEADEALLERLFALDTALLRKGAAAMLTAGGDLGEALFGAGGGIAGLRRVRQHLEARRDDLAPARRTAGRPLYRALDELHGARTDLRNALVRPQSWLDLNRQIAFVREHRASLFAKQGKGQEKIARLERVKRVRPWLEQLANARTQLEMAANAPRLSDDIEARWQDVCRTASLSECEHAAEAERIEALSRRIDAEAVDRRLLDEHAAIEDLERTRNKIAADRRDLPGREAERRQTAERLAALVRDLGIADADAFAAISVTGPQIAAARALIKRHAGLCQMLLAVEARAEDSEREMIAAKTALEEIVEPEDTTQLAELADDIRRDGDPARRLAGLAAKREEQEARLAAALAKLPLWRRDLESLAAVVPPTRGMIARAAEALDSARRSLAEAERAVERLRAEHAEAARRLTQERSGTPVPDAAAIGAARAHRDLGWSLVRRSRFEGEALDGEIAKYAGTLGLAAAFERAIGNADRLADRRDDEGQRIARIAEQERAVVSLDRDIAGLDERCRQAAETRAEAARQWAVLAAPLGLAEIPEPGDLGDFIAAREIVLDARAERDRAARAVADETDRQEAARLRLAALLPAAECGSLDRALAAARRITEHSAARRKRHDQLRERLEGLRSTHSRTLDERQQAKQALADWEAGWRDCLSALQRPAGEVPAATERAIELIDEARQLSGKLADFDHRIAGMRANIAEFEAHATGLAAALLPDAAVQPAEIVADQLNRQLVQNREIAARRGLLVSQLREARARGEDAATRQRAAQAGLEVLRTEIGASSADEVAERIAASCARAQAEGRLSEVEARLAEIGDGWPFETLAREAAEMPAEEVEAELARLRDDDRRIGSEREAAAEDETRLAGELRRIGAGEGAIEAEGRRQAALASATRISGEAVLYHAASCLLQRAIERLRDQSANGLVERVGAVFSGLTAGLYSGVAVDEDDKGIPFLVAVAADRHVSKQVGELSEGECDQLYLALRIAMIGDYAGKAPALPFIGDDLLQTFDDYGRTGQALAAFVELSNAVQVILFSHHRQLVEAACSRLPPDAVNVCELAA